MRFILSFIFLIFAASLFADEKMCDGMFVKTDIIKINSTDSELHFVEDSNALVVNSTKDHTLIYLDLITGKEKRYEYSNQSFKDFTRFSSDKTKAFFKGTGNNTLVLLDLKSGRQFNIQNPLAETNDANNILYKKDEKFFIGNIENGKLKERKLPLSLDDVEDARFSSDGKKLYMYGRTNSFLSGVTYKTASLNLETGKKTVFDLGSAGGGIRWPT